MDQESPIVNKYPISVVGKRLSDIEWGIPEKSRLANHAMCNTDRCVLVTTSRLSMNGLPVTMTIVGRLLSLTCSAEERCKIRLEPLRESDMDAFDLVQRCMEWDSGASRCQN